MSGLHAALGGCLNCLLPDGITPPPWRMLVLLFVSNTCSAASLTYQQPFLLEMVKNFGHEESEAGYYVGIIAASFHLGRAVSSYGWGHLSDKLGRKPALICSFSLLIVTTSIFGLAKSAVMAGIFGLLAGCANGIAVILKALAYDISDSNNQSFGISTLSIGWGCGSLLGPVIGGLLASYKPLLTFPFLLPGAMLATACASVFAFTICCLSNRCYAGASGDEVDTNQEDNINNTNIAPLITDNPTVNNRPTIVKLCFSFKRLITITIYCIISYCVTYQRTLLIVWCPTGIDYGGVGFTTQQLALLMGVAAVFMLLLQPVLFTVMERRMGASRMCLYSLLLSLLTVVPVPALRFLSHMHWLLWLLLIISESLACFALLTAMASMVLITNNAAPDNLIGSMNGLAMVCSSIGRLLGPLTAGAAFAASIDNPTDYPFDVNFAFQLLGLAIICAAACIYLLPAKLDSQRRDWI